MDVLSILLTIGVLLLGVAGKLAIGELQDWLPAVARKMVVHAANQLPEGVQERHREEWLADNKDFPGKLSKIWHACGCLLAARRVALISLAESDDTLFTDEFLARIKDRIAFYKTLKLPPEAQKLRENIKLKDTDSSIERGANALGCSVEVFVLATCDVVKSFVPESEKNQVDDFMSRLK